MEALQSKEYHIKWTSCADLPSQMYGASVSAEGNNVYVTAGNATGPDARNGVYCYDITSDKWNTLPPPGHDYGVLCMIDKKLSVFGGDDPVTCKAFSKVSTYNRVTNSWSSYYPNMMHSRFKPGVVANCDYIVVIGGSVSKGNHLDSIEVMNWQLRSPWIEVSIRLPVPMFAIKPTVSAEHLLIVGYSGAEGRHNTSFQIPFASIKSSFDQSISPNQQTGRWDQLPPASHWFTATVPYSSPSLIIGGHDDKYVPTSAISIYNEFKKSYEEVDSLTCARSNVGVANINSSTIIIVGGCTDADGVSKSKASSLPLVEIGCVVRR